MLIFAHIERNSYFNTISYYMKRKPPTLLLYILKANVADAKIYTFFYKHTREIEKFPSSRYTLHIVKIMRENYQKISMSETFFI